jgi:hypothetical protein
MDDQLREAVRRKLQEQGYLTPAEVAAHYRTTQGTLRWWRYARRGPAFVKLGEERGAKVLYPVAAVNAFDAELAQQARQADAQLARGGDRARAG